MKGIPQPTFKVYGCYFSTIPKGDKVYYQGEDGGLVTLLLTKDKEWHDTTLSATVIDSEEYGSPIGTHYDDWCAEVCYTFTYYPCGRG